MWTRVSVTHLYTLHTLTAHRAAHTHGMVQCFLMLPTHILITNVVIKRGPLYLHLRNITSKVVSQTQISISLLARITYNRRNNVEH